MLVSKMTLPHWSHTFTFIITLWSRQFIMQPSSPVQKLNSLLLDVALTRLAAKRMFPKSLLSLTPFMWLRNYLMISPFRIKSIWQQFFTNFDNSSPLTKKILLNSVNAQVILIGDFTSQLTKSWSHSTLNLYFQAKYLGITARNPIVTTSSINGK